MKLFCAGLMTETNSFAPLPTSLETFQQGLMAPGTCPTDQALSGYEMMFAAKRRAAAGEFELVEGSCFYAYPAGLTSKEAYETMREAICDELRAALPVDGVVLGVHGGMIAHGYPDPEGDLLAHIRAIVGAKTAIGVEMDLHCIVNRQRLDHADVIVLYKEYPHIDTVEQADAVIDLVKRAAQGETRLTPSLFDCRQIDSYPTTAPAMRAFVDRLKRIEAEDPLVESISFVHGFVFCDVPDLSARILVYTNDAKPHGDALAAKLGHELIALRGQTASPLLSIDAAIDAALAAPATPVVIADPTDNAGGGAPSDNTQVLARLIARRVENVAVGPIWDPGAVRICMDAGVGATLPLRLGGKVAATSGLPVDATVLVTGIKSGAWQRYGDCHIPAGDSVAIRIDDIDIVLTSERTQAFSPELFAQVGIAVAQRRAVFLKSVNHFMGGFGTVAAQVLYVNGEGPLQRDYAKITYSHVIRPIWPLDAEVTPALIY